MISTFRKLLNSCNRLLKHKCSGSLNRVYTSSNQIRIRFSEFGCIPQAQSAYKTVLGVSILSWLGFVDDDEKKESEFIMTLKRGILAHSREEYSKAEQLLHVALRIAQFQRDEQGITYCYDIMANVAFDDRKLEKARKLFVKVVERLLYTGLAQDDLKVIHINLKLARIFHLTGDNETAELAYSWCLKQIEKHRNTDFDSKMLYGVIQDWYAQFLLDSGDVNGSLKHLKEAHSVCSESLGENSPQNMLLLNDLGTTSWRAGDKESAENLFNSAIKVGNKLEDKSHLGVVYANLGLILLEKGIIKLAEKHCKEALHLGNQHKNKESVEQANYCFDQIKTNLSK